MKKIVYLVVYISVLLVACTPDYVPKPRGYFRIALPQRAYTMLDTALPYQFEMPVYAQIKPDDSPNTQPHWVNIDFGNLNARLHVSYHPVHGNLEKILEDSHALAYKHTVKADAIDERVFVNEEKKVFGIFYAIAGNAATPMQFYLTDSTHHYLRGALYFNSKPNKDSLAPVIQFLQPDIIHIIETFQWNELNKLK